MGSFGRRSGKEKRQQEEPRGELNRLLGRPFGSTFNAKMGAEIFSKFILLFGNHFLCLHGQLAARLPPSSIWLLIARLLCLPKSLQFQFAPYVARICAHCLPLELSSANGRQSEGAEMPNRPLLRARPIAGLFAFGARWNRGWHLLTKWPASRSASSPIARPFASFLLDPSYLGCLPARRHEED